MLRTEIERPPYGEAGRSARRSRGGAQRSHQAVGRVDHELGGLCTPEYHELAVTATCWNKIELGRDVAVERPSQISCTFELARREPVARPRDGCRRR